MKMLISYDASCVIFRFLFSLIFVGLGMEHLFADELLQLLMPEWIGFKREVSILTGVVLLLGGLLIMFGYRIQWGAIILGSFLITVTAFVHLPAIFVMHPEVSGESAWLWDAYQRSNLFKNLCMLGVCVYFLHHKAGKYSIEELLSARKPQRRLTETDVK